jgi:hypothetical protein
MPTRRPTHYLETALINNMSVLYSRKSCSRRVYVISWSVSSRINKSGPYKWPYPNPGSIKIENFFRDSLNHSNMSPFQKVKFPFFLSYQNPKIRKASSALNVCTSEIERFGSLPITEIREKLMTSYTANASVLNRILISLPPLLTESSDILQNYNFKYQTIILSSMFFLFPSHEYVVSKATELIIAILTYENLAR